MSGYYKLIRKDDDLAILDIAGWKGHAIALNRIRLERMKKEIEEIQNHVKGEGHLAAHLLWEHINTLLSLTESSNDKDAA